MSSIVAGQALPESAPDAHAQLRRAVIASTVGTTIEWYDFFLYSIVTGLVFAKLYFPKSDPLVGTLEAFAVYAVGFVARPVGAAIFGHFGDRVGRKSTLIATLLLMGVATFLVALVPTYERIGVWGAVLLTVLRFVQGVGVGGEWGGTVPRQPGGSRLERDLRRSVPRLGLAGSVPPQPAARRGGVVHPPRHSRDAGVLASRQGTPHRARTGAAGAPRAAP